MFSVLHAIKNLFSVVQTQHLSPCIILIKTIGHAGNSTTKDRDRDSSGGEGELGGEGEGECEGESVLGMFMSSAVSPPSGSVRGDGMCFCFRLDGPEARCYRWVGQSRHSVQALQSTELQFALCATNYLAFGGSAKSGTNALRLSADLTTCVTGESDTFCNPPLGAGQGGRGLEVGEVEVFCGKLSHVW